MFTAGGTELWGGNCCTEHLCWVRGGPVSHSTLPPGSGRERDAQRRAEAQGWLISDVSLILSWPTAVLAQGLPDVIVAAECGNNPQ